MTSRCFLVPILWIFNGLIAFWGIFFSFAEATDPRIRTEFYNAERVVKLTAHLGFQMALEFQADETIENVAIGDSASWQVTPNRRGNMLIVKPVNRALPTNMTVVTTQRRYSFALESKPGDNVPPAQMTFVLKFLDPAEAVNLRDNAASSPDAGAGLQATYQEPERVNTSYSFEGSPEIVPAEIFDDNKSTYFRWSAATPTPAIFLLGRKGQRSIVNHSYVGPYIVVDRVTERFHLQLGDFSTILFNDDYRIEDLGAAAPKPRPSKPGLFGRIFGRSGTEGGSNAR